MEGTADKSGGRVPCICASVCVVLCAVLCGGCATTGAAVPGEAVGAGGADTALHELTRQQGESAGAGAAAEKDGERLEGELSDLEEILRGGADEDGRFGEIVRAIQERGCSESEQSCGGDTEAGRGEQETGREASQG